MAYLSYSDFTPANGAEVGSTFTISVKWSSSISGVGNGFTYIYYRRNGGAWLKDQKSHSPIPSSYTHTLQLTMGQGDRVDFFSYANGSAYGFGESAVTDTRYVTAPLDTVGPTISGRQPANAASEEPIYTAGIRFRATISDTWGVASAALYVDGGLVDTTSGSDIDVYHPLEKGAHTWYVTATDDAGNTTTDSTYDLTVENAAPKNPLALKIGGVAIAEAATRVSAVARVSWTSIGDLNPEDTVAFKIEVDYNSGGYSTLVASQAETTYDWTPTTEGTATLRITANDGTEDCPVPLTGSCAVTTGSVPNTPTLTDPGGGSYREGSTQSVAWTPASPVDPDVGDTVTYELEFSELGDFTDAVLIAEGLTASPYDWTLAASLVTVDTATCKLRLRARDNYEMVSAWSTSTAFTVIHNAVPTIAIISPASGATITNRMPELIVEVDDDDVGDVLDVEIQLAESADYTIGVINPDTSLSLSGWEFDPPAYSEVVVADVPVGYWRLGEAAGAVTAVDEMGSYDATWTGSPAGLGSAGLLIGDNDLAVDFDGTDDEAVSASLGLDARSETLECWVEVSPPSTGAFVKVGTNAPAISSNGYAIGIGNTSFETSGSNLLVLWEKVRWIDTGYDFSSAGVYHVVLTIDSGGFPEVFVNGVSVYDSGVGTLPLAPTGGVYIGGYTSGVPSNRHFGGVVDEVAVYDRILTPTEIAEHYDAGAAGGAYATPARTVTFTPTSNLHYDLYYYRARVTDGSWVSDWVEDTFRVAPAPGDFQVTIGGTDYYVSGMQITETSGGEPSSMSWTIPSDVWGGEAKGVTVSVALNFEGTARTWTGTLEDVKSGGAYVNCTALLDDAYLSRKLATGNVASKDLGQALKDLVTSYGSPLTGAAIDTTTGVSMAITGDHKQLREHFADALKSLPNYMLWVDSTGDVHFVDTADLAVPGYLLKEN